MGLIDNAKKKLSNITSDLGRGAANIVGGLGKLPIIGPKIEQGAWWLAGTRVNPKFWSYDAFRAKLHYLKKSIISKVFEIAKKFFKSFTKTSMKNMDKSAAKRVSQMMGDPLNGKFGEKADKVYSRTNIAKTNIEGKAEATVAKSAEKVAGAIEKMVKPMPKQDIGEVLKAATEKNVADPMAMTQPGMSEIGKTVEKGRG